MAVMNTYGIISLVILSIIHGISTEKYLLQEITFGNVDKAERLIRTSLDEIDLEKRNDNGETPLWLALYKKYDNLALLLIESGANVNAVSGIGDDRKIYCCTPLHVAVWNHLTSCVSALIAGGALVNAKQWVGYTPLMLLAKYSSGRYDVDIARILLKAGADVNEPEYAYNNIIHSPRPLHHAARNWNAPLAELLLSKGAFVNAMEGITYHKAPIDHVMIYKKLLSGSSGKAKDTAIILLNNGADQTELNDFPKIFKAFWTPAHFKSEPGARECFDSFFLKFTGKITEVTKLLSKEKNVESFSLLRYVRKGFFEFGMFFNFVFSIKRKILESAGEFDIQGMFALYRLLKNCYESYNHVKTISVLEDMKWDIFDYVSNEISKQTYFEKIPLDLIADILYEGGYYGWKIERFAWNVALAAYPYRFNINPYHISGEIAFNLLLESEKDL